MLEIIGHRSRIGIRNCECGRSAPMTTMKRVPNKKTSTRHGTRPIADVTGLGQLNHSNPPGRIAPALASVLQVQHAQMDA